MDGFLCVLLEGVFHSHTSFSSPLEHNERWEISEALIDVNTAPNHSWPPNAWN
uniref:Uncharacterized protein n=1 Tax=Anguilla anguilla TaxID=7936 RepID=A0A0E9UVQ0_ANGAN